MKKIGITMAFLLAACGHEQRIAVAPRTIAANSVEYNDVLMAVQQASDGDTVTVPAGTASWNTQLKVEKGITLKGQTTVAGGGTKQAAANDQTIIVDEGGTPAAIAMNTSQPFRLSGFTIRGGSVKPSGSSHAAVGLYPQAGQPFRMDNMHFALLKRRAVWTAGWAAAGVEDNIIINAQSANQSFYFESGLYDNKRNGHGSWADYPWFGTDKFVFVEDSNIYGVPNTVTGNVDNMNGARFVMRHCYFSDSTVSGHGTESGPQRGNRCAEIYDNTFDWTTMEPNQGRSGTFIWHDNVWTGKSGRNNPGVCYVLKCYRTEYRGKYWEYAQGTNIWDQNDTDGDGNFVEGQPPHLFDSGTATSNSGKQQGNTIIFEDNTKHWAPHQWAGYSVSNLTKFPYPNFGMWIRDNTENAIIYVNNWASDVQPVDWIVFSIGDKYEINRVVRGLDQAGAGKGDLLEDRNNVPINTVTGTKSYPHQQQEQCFSWNNVVTATGETLGFKGGTSVKEGRDFINLGKDLPVDAIPPAVRDIYNAARNGVDYESEYPYPHPLRASGLPTPNPNTPTPAPTSTPAPTVAPSPTPAPTAAPSASPPPSGTTPPSSNIPAAPSNLAGNAGGVTLEWVDNATNETGYQVARSPMDAKNNCTGFAPLVSNLPPNTTTYRDITAQSGFSYCYRVRAEGKSGNFSPFSEIVKVTVP